MCMTLKVEDRTCSTDMQSFSHKNIAAWNPGACPGICKKRWAQNLKAFYFLFFLLFIFLGGGGSSETS